MARRSEFESRYRGATREEQEAVTNRWAMEIAPLMEPQREDFDGHRVMFSAHGRGRTMARSLAVWGATGYVLTGALGAVTIDTLLRGRQRAAGMVPAVRVVGAPYMLNELNDEGILGTPVETLG